MTKPADDCVCTSRWLRATLYVIQEKLQGYFSRIVILLYIYIDIDIHHFSCHTSGCRPDVIFMATTTVQPRSVLYFYAPISWDTGP